MPPKLFPYQEEAVGKLDSGKILVGGVGVGKTITAAAYYMRIEADADILVITTAKVRDGLSWQKAFASFGVGKKEGETVAGRLTVDSWNNIGKYTDLQGHFVIFDEQRLVGSGQWVKSFYKIAQKNRWILLTATPADSWLDYIPVFVANGHYKNKTEFLREHVQFSSYTRFPKVERYHHVARLVRIRNDLVVPMHVARHTTRHSKVVEVDHDAALLERVLRDRWNPWKKQPLKNAGELFMAMRRAVNSDASRLHAVRTLLEEHDRLIVFYNFTYELDSLRTLSDSVLVAEWNGSRHDEIPSGNRWVYLVQYAAGAEGWNCIETNATCFYSLHYSYKVWEQAHGRIDRVNTPYKDLYYYVLMSRSAIDRAIMQALNGKKNFNLGKFRGKMGW